MKTVSVCGLILCLAFAGCDQDQRKSPGTYSPSANEDKPIKHESYAVVKARLDSVAKAHNLRKKLDEMGQYTYFEDKSSTTYVDHDDNYLYIMDLWEHKSFTLRLKIQYVATDWMFVRGYDIKADDVMYHLDPAYDDITRNNSSGEVSENLDVHVHSPNKGYADIVSAIVKAKSVKVRIRGERGHEDRTFSASQLRAFRNVWTAYMEAVGEYGGTLYE